MKKSSNAIMEVLVVAIAAGVFLCLPPAYGQVITGSILGTITDSSGAVVPAAKVTVTDLGTNVPRVFTTDASGNYSVTAIPPGTYKVSAEKEGFSIGTHTDIALFAGQTVRVDITLQPGAVTQSVTVSGGSAPILQTDTAETGRNINTTLVEDLPLSQGHNFQNLVNLVPGAEPAAFQHSTFNNPEGSLVAPVNGAPSRTNLYNIEGINDDQHSGEMVIYIPGMEAIQEVAVTASNYEPAQGAALGAIVNVIIKSGSNAFHGEAYEFYTGNVLDSRNFFANVGPGGSPYKLAHSVDNYFGGNFGGPIKKDKTFFFVDFYYHPTSTGHFYALSVPTAAMRQGMFTDPYLGTIYDPNTGDTADCLPGGTFSKCGTGRTQVTSGGGPNLMAVDPIVQQLLSHVVAPNANLTATGKALYTNNLLINAPFQQNTPSLDVKIDQYLGQHDHIFGRVGWEEPKTTQAGLYGDWGGPIGIGGLAGVEGTGDDKIWSTGINWVHVFSPTLLTEMRVGLGRYYNSVYPPGYGKNLSAGIGIPGANIDQLSSGILNVSGEGFTDPIVGHQSNYPFFHIQDNIIFMDHWTKVYGNHSLTFGLDYTRLRDDYSIVSNVAGAFTFCAGNTELRGSPAPPFSNANAFASFLLGVPCAESQGHVYVFPTYRQNQFYPYFGDKWQATRKLTVTVGLRWEDYEPGTAAFRAGLSQYNDTNNTLTLSGVGSVPRNEGLQPDHRNWGPRLGLAYRLTGHDVLRAGFGVSSSPYPLDYYLTNYPIAPVQTWSNLNTYGPAIMNDGTPGSFEKGFPPLAPLQFPSNGIITLTGNPALANLQEIHLDPKWKQPYTMSWNAAYQRQLPGNWMLDIAYVGNRTVRSSMLNNLNVSTAYGCGATCQPEYAPFGRTAATLIFFAQARNAYDSLQVKVDHHFAHNFAVTSSYTWGKAIGYEGEDGNYVTGLLDYVNMRRNWAPTDFNIASILSQTLVWNLPFGKGKPFLSSGVGNIILGGWELSGSWVAHTGFPLAFSCGSCSAFNTVGSTSFPNQTGAFNKLHGINLASPWFDTSVFNANVPAGTQGNVGNYVQQGPGFFSMNAALSRTIKLNERFKVLLRTEWLNATNTPLFANPGTSCCGGSFGYVTGTAGSGGQRTIDLVGKLLF